MTPTPASIRETNEIDTGEVDPRDRPWVTKATITGDMLRAIQAVNEYRRSKSAKQLTLDELDVTGFNYTVSYATLAKSETKPTFVHVFLGPVLTNIFDSAHFQSNRGEAQYLVSIETGEVICWTLGGRLKNVAEGRSCPTFHEVPDRGPP